MAKGISVHIGLNGVDPDHYGGWDGQLTACEFDAKDMQKIAKQKGFTTKLLLTTHATASAVRSEISNAAAQLKSGDIFLISYSGHGGQIPDTNHDEADRQDETWVLYDRELIDDELYAQWSEFKAGVRILVFSDSCHSGTVTRMMPTFRRANTGIALPVRNRLMPPDIALRTYHQHQKYYDDIQKSAGPAEKARVRASVLLISGCQDNQLSADGDRNGLFTENLRIVWDSGKFKGNYSRFRDKITALMPANQTPKYYRVGTHNPT